MFEKFVDTYGNRMAEECGFYFKKGFKITIRLMMECRDDDIKLFFVVRITKSQVFFTHLTFPYFYHKNVLPQTTYMLPQSSSTKSLTLRCRISTFCLYPSSSSMKRKWGKTSEKHTISVYFRVTSDIVLLESQRVWFGGTYRKAEQS